MTEKKPSERRPFTFGLREAIILAVVGMTIVVLASLGAN